MTEHSKTVGGSSTGRLIACPGHYSLVKSLPPEEGPKAAADRGSMLHNVMEQILMEDKEPQDFLGYEDPDYPGHICTLQEIHEAVIPAYNAFKQIAKEYGAFDFECETKVAYPHIEGSFGTTDIVGANDAYSFVIDWKFGRGVVPAKNNKQLRYYGYSAANTPETADLFSPDRLVVLAIIQPKLDNALDLEIIEYSELMAYADELNEAWELANSDNPPLKEGKHCDFCRAETYNLCELKRKGVDLGLTKVNTDITVQGLPELLQLCDQLEPFIKKVRAEAHRLLENGEKVQGYKLVPKRGTRKWTDEDHIRKALFARRLKKSDVVKEKVLSPAQAEKIFKNKGWDFSPMEEYISATSSGNNMVTDDDPRPSAITTGQGVDLDL